jgi:hypothetical protein
MAIYVGSWGQVILAQLLLLTTTLGYCKNERKSLPCWIMRKMQVEALTPTKNGVCGILCYCNG